ncbi:unnamed protein product [Leptidea sinapis]|uniref:K Homology domain-containing protein n=1 Tax=Leptidea sinapis TaxID=189913 RepID=A0A5E4QVJ2_9NEOP|nr:unnamed protein product [Leptidea sinapis]
MLGEVELQDLDGDEDNDDCDVVMVHPNRYYVNLHVSQHFMGKIIGKKGATKMGIQRDTKTDIKIPKHGEDTDIVIYGPAPANVKAARRRINIIVMAAKEKLPYTHFISIPFNQAAVMERFEKFKATVLRDFNGRGLDESCFIRASKLHITVRMLSLMDNEERLLASKVLTEANEKVIRPMLKDYLPLRIRLKGLSYMNDDPKEMHVLYGRVEEDEGPTGILQDTVNALAEFLYKTGVVINRFNDTSVKMHVTLINTRYRNSGSQSDEEGSSSKKNIARESFDGSKILSSLGDYDFGVVEWRDIHLSQRSVVGPDGYYQATHVVSCVGNN